MARFDPTEQAYRRRRLERDERLEQQRNRCDALQKQIEDLDRELSSRQSAREAMLARLDDIRPEKLGGLDESTRRRLSDEYGELARSVMYLDDQILPQIRRGREAMQNDWTISGCGTLP